MIMEYVLKAQVKAKKYINYATYFREFDVGDIIFLKMTLKNIQQDWENVINFDQGIVDHFRLLRELEQ